MENQIKQMESIMVTHVVIGRHLPSKGNYLPKSKDGKSILHLKNEATKVMNMAELMFTPIALQAENYIAYSCLNGLHTFATSDNRTILSIVNSLTAVKEFMLDMDCVSPITILFKPFTNPTLTQLVETFTDLLDLDKETLTYAIVESNGEYKYAINDRVFGEINDDFTVAVGKAVAEMIEMSKTIEDDVDPNVITDVEVVGEAENV